MLAALEAGSFERPMTRVWIVEDFNLTGFFIALADQ
jgi:hypothetical protein